MANSDNITIEARPEPIAEPIGIKAAKTAVLVVDMQNDFGSIGGMVDRAGIDISPVRRVIAPTARMRWPRARELMSIDRGIHRAESRAAQ